MKKILPVPVAAAVTFALLLGVFAFPTSANASASERRAIETINCSACFGLHYANLDLARASTSEFVRVGISERTNFDFGGHSGAFLGFRNLFGTGDIVIGDHFGENFSPKSKPESDDSSDMPEPGTLVLLATGLVGLAIRRVA